MARRLLPIFTLLMAAGLASSWMFGSAMMRPTPGTVAPVAPPARDFFLRSDDGLRIASSYWPGRKPDGPGVLILHGNGASRAYVRDGAEWLAGLGYAVLAIDFRGHGISDNSPKSFGLYESHDARIAFTWLKREHRGANIAIIGISLGGAAVLLGQNGPIPAEALVLQAVYPNLRAAVRNRMTYLAGPVIGTVGEPFLSYQAWPRLAVSPTRLSPIAAVRHYRGKLLVIGGEADLFTPPAEIEAMRTAGGAGAQSWLLPQADHATASGMGDARYRRRLQLFLQDAIGAP